ncbi:MAG: hypothetical protein WAW07_16190, partial [Bacteroidales bacterium]
MKKIVLCVMAGFLSLAFVPHQLKAATTEEPASIPAPKPAESSEAKTLMIRLDEIKATDKSKLNADEKKELRKEVKAIKSNLKEIGNGVYLSGAAIMLI